MIKSTTNPERDELVGNLEAKQHSRVTSPPKITSAAKYEQGAAYENTPVARGEWDTDLSDETVVYSHEETGRTPTTMNPDLATGLALTGSGGTPDTEPDAEEYGDDMMNEYTDGFGRNWRS